MKKAACFLATLALGLPSLARADPAGSPQTLATSEGDSDMPSVAPAERGFLYTDDPSLAAPGHVILSAGMGNVTHTGEERPVGAGDIIPTVGAELGVLPRLSLFVNAGAVIWGESYSGVSPVTLEAGPRVLLTAPASRSFVLTLQPSYGLDFYGNSTLLLNAAFAWSYRILRLAVSGTVSHTFQRDADPADLQASASATVALPLGFRVGAEGVVTDLEEIATPGAEGGSSAFAGPTLGWEWRHRFQIVAGPAYGFGPNYSGFLGRVALSAQL